MSEARIRVAQTEHVVNFVNGLSEGRITIHSHTELLDAINRAFTAGVSAAQDDARIERQIAMDAERLRRNPIHVLPWPETGAIIDGIRETVKAAQGEAGA